MEAVSLASPLPLFASIPLVMALGCSPRAAQPSMVHKMARTVCLVWPLFLLLQGLRTPWVGGGCLRNGSSVSHTPEATGEGLPEHGKEEAFSSGDDATRIVGCHGSCTAESELVSRIETFCQAVSSKLLDVRQQPRGLPEQVGAVRWGGRGKQGHAGQSAGSFLLHACHPPHSPLGTDPKEILLFISYRKAYMEI